MWFWCQLVQSVAYAPHFATLWLVKSVCCVCVCGGAYMQDLTFYLVNTPPSLCATPRCDMGTVYYRPEAGSTLVCLCFSHPQILLVKIDWQRLATAKTAAFSRFQVLSMCCIICEHTCDWRWIPKLFCGCWLHSCVTTPPRTETLQRRSFDEESPEDHVAGHICLGGLCMR